MRKPRNRFKMTGLQLECLRRDDEFPEAIYVEGQRIPAKEARVIAAWLLKAAQWLEEEEEKR